MAQINTVLLPAVDPETKKINPWYTRLSWTPLAGVDIDNRLIIQAFTTLALADRKTFSTSQFEGLIKGGSEGVKEILDAQLTGRGGFVAAQYIPFKLDSSYRNWQYFWDEGIVAVTYNDDDASVTIFALNEQDRLALVDAIRPLTGKKKTAGRCFVMVSTANGVQMQSVSSHAQVKFEPDNYLEDTVKKYHYAVEQLKSDTPSGRIMILRGPPGAGKSYCIRALIGAVDRATFVVVPAAMVGELDGPNLIGTLLNTYRNADGPIVLILEDADSVLAPRGADNMHSISSLLNLSDGILGNLMDLRIIATTNALKEELDEAVTRDGRLCIDAEFTEIPYEQANRVYQRLMQNSEAILPEKKSYRLASIYKTARPDTKEDLKTTSSKRRTVGFQDLISDLAQEVIEAPELENVSLAEEADTNANSIQAMSYEEIATKFGKDFADDIAASGFKVVAADESVGGFKLEDVPGAPTHVSGLHVNVNSAPTSLSSNETEIDTLVPDNNKE